MFDGVILSRDSLWLSSYSDLHSSAVLRCSLRKSQYKMTTSFDLSKAGKEEREVHWMPFKVDRSMDYANVSHYFDVNRKTNASCQ